MSDKSIYQFNVQKLNGEEISLSEYKDKVLLIVNTASQCGFTPQLKELAALKSEFKDQPFEILAFPSNDFGQQEPLDARLLSKRGQAHAAVVIDLVGKLRAEISERVVR